MAKKNNWDPRLSPYSSLQADPLKISGRGDCDAARYITDELWMPFVEPQVLELESAVTERGLPNLEAEDPVEVLKLLRKWNHFGLLELHSAKVVHPGQEGKVKIFNAFKSLSQDRQIGERRWRNAFEGRIPGPSKPLPTGAQICSLLLKPDHGVRISVTDRSDFYHQMSCSFERSRSNLVWPPMKLGDFKNTGAHERFLT